MSSMGNENDRRFNERIEQFKKDRLIRRESSAQREPLGGTKLNDATSGADKQEIDQKYLDKFHTFENLPRGERDEAFQTQDEYLDLKSFRQTYIDIREKETQITLKITDDGKLGISSDKPRSTTEFVENLLQDQITGLVIETVAGGFAGAAYEAGKMIYENVKDRNLQDLVYGKSPEAVAWRQHQTMTAACDLVAEQNRKSAWRHGVALNPAQESQRLYALCNRYEVTELKLRAYLLKNEPKLNDPKWARISERK